MKQQRVIISGGGTGGHLYPALALGWKLKERNPRLQIIFVGGSRELEKKIMKRHEEKFIPLRIKGIKGKGWKMITSLLLLPLSFLKSFVILLRYRPRLAIGAGGYSSGPIVLLAAWLKIPTFILEQNFYPGFTNRLLIPWVKKAVVAFEGSLPYFKGKGVFLGNPVRQEFYALSPKPRNSHLSLLIFGGSQGSSFLNKAMTAALPRLTSRKAELRIIHQTGEKDIQWVKDSYLNHGFLDAEVAPYFHDMAFRFQKSDLVISRAGATTIAELIASQKASILIPFSQAADNHQVLNAEELERIKGAEVVLEEEVTSEAIANKIFGFMEDKEKINQMEKNLMPLKKANVAERISDLCFDLMEAQN